MMKAIIKILFLALSFSTSHAFVVAPAAHRGAVVLKAKTENNHDDTRIRFQVSSQWKAAVVSTLVAVSQHPLIALAEDVDDYEYGAVSAPSFVPIVGGLLAILTALLPIALRGGEEAFEEMKDTGSFGKGQDVLKSRKKK